VKQTREAAKRRCKVELLWDNEGEDSLLLSSPPPLLQASAAITCTIHTNNTFIPKAIGTRTESNTTALNAIFALLALDLHAAMALYVPTTIHAAVLLLWRLTLPSVLRQPSPVPASLCLCCHFYLHSYHLQLNPRTTAVSFTPYHREQLPSKTGTWAWMAKNTITKRLLLLLVLQY
jgi:hypothetical protein